MHVIFLAEMYHVVSVTQQHEEQDEQVYDCSPCVCASARADLASGKLPAVTMILSTPMTSKIYPSFAFIRGLVCRHVLCCVSPADHALSSTCDKSGL